MQDSPGIADVAPSICSSLVPKVLAMVENLYEVEMTRSRDRSALQGPIGGMRWVLCCIIYVVQSIYPYHSLF